MNKRRAHRKSRGGCLECKRRHIKCDEGQPSCSHCLRHSIHCLYRRSVRVTRDTSSGEVSSPQPDSLCHFIAPDRKFNTPQTHPGCLFGMMDMALLHNWITVAGNSILNAHDIDHYWHSVIPSIGFEHQYVMHSILSLSALHMAHGNPSDNEDLLQIAAEHRSKALDRFTEDLHQVGPHNSDALFANATLTFFYAFVSFSSIFQYKRTGTKSQMAQVLGAEWIPLVRGTAAVLEPIYKFVRVGPLRSFLELYNFEELDIKESTHVSTYDKMLMTLQSLWSTDEHAGIYDVTLRNLLRCSIWMKQFENMEDRVKADWGYNRSCSGPFIWLFQTPAEYFTLQQQRQPPALIIFAYYGILLHRLNNYWWSENCGRSIVNAVDACLGPYWSSWLDWPKQAVGLEPC